MAWQKNIYIYIYKQHNNTYFTLQEINANAVKYFYSNHNIKMIIHSFMSQSLLNIFLHSYVSYKHIYNNAVTVSFIWNYKLLLYYIIITLLLLLLLLFLFCCWT